MRPALEFVYGIFDVLVVLSLVVNLLHRVVSQPEGFVLRKIALNCNELCIYTLPAFLLGICKDAC